MPREGVEGLRGEGDGGDDGGRGSTGLGEVSDQGGQRTVLTPCLRQSVCLALRLTRRSRRCLFWALKWNTRNAVKLRRPKAGGEASMTRHELAWEWDSRLIE